MKNSTRDFQCLKVSEVTIEELLFELLSRSVLSPASNKIEFYTPHHAVVFGIGNDDAAYLHIGTDSFQVLKKRVIESNPGM